MWFFFFFFISGNTKMALKKQLLLFIYFFLQKSSKVNWSWWKKRKGGKERYFASSFSFFSYCVLNVLAFCGDLKGTIFHLIVCVLLYDSWRHTNSLQNGYEIFLVEQSGRESTERDFLMTFKNNEKKLLGKKTFQRNFLTGI